MADMPVCVLSASAAAIALQQNERQTGTLVVEVLRLATQNCWAEATLKSRLELVQKVFAGWCHITGSEGPMLSLHWMSEIGGHSNCAWWDAIRHVCLPYANPDIP